ncbi:MAG: PorT family protein [Prevotellaceae bacterium]|jgi:hypothetical protein|nr:PorT family protein [Prevotellaceae bacterium]
MKKYIVAAFLCLLLCAQATAQEKRSFTIRITPEIGGMELTNNEDGSSVEMNPSFVGVGIQANLPVARNWDVVAGLSYVRAKGNAYTGTSESLSVESSKLTGLTAPVLVRFHFLKYAFVDGGIYLSNLENSSGEHKFIAGPDIGFGVAYTFPTGLLFSIRPNVRYLSWFADTDLKLKQFAVEFGIGYQF